ncbi:hypothetical protein RHMOL_Rhmol05G0225200 [Rhododendron molle]|uniref:Uncharacterized protein n=1 Tax=Rhododendron molle TaxID=49168 RepID=A0ACC0NT03_RHOML|nr:hypothetical protein RHMOL_Rhmol05G0225200 [Rhododendron molle]
MDSFQDKKTRIRLRVRLQPPTSAGNQKASWEAQSKQCFICVSVEELEGDYHVTLHDEEDAGDDDDDDNLELVPN